MPTRARGINYVGLIAGFTTIGIYQYGIPRVRQLLGVLQDLHGAGIGRDLRRIDQQRQAKNVENFYTGAGTITHCRNS